MPRSYLVVTTFFNEIALCNLHSLKSLIIVRRVCANLLNEIFVEIPSKRKLLKVFFNIEKQLNDLIKNFQ